MGVSLDRLCCPNVWTASAEADPTMIQHNGSFMIRSFLAASFVFVSMVYAASAAEPVAVRLMLTSPLDYQVFQRQTAAQGKVVVAGQVDAGKEGGPKAEAVEARLLGKTAGGELPGTWLRIPLDADGTHFRGELATPAGGWYQVETRAIAAGKPLAEAAVAHVGVGEVFLVAGQSNSSNHGSGRQKPASGLVTAFDGKKWRIADDPQPGGSGDGGSFTPAFGDAMAVKFGVPIGMVNIGVGATSVREWLPKGERIVNRPTTGGNVKAVGPHEWEATGALFDRLVSRLAAFGPGGYRAILWHQGESDAGQARAGYPADVQITGEQYRVFMEKLVRASRERAGWPIPWFTALVTYHGEKDAADEEFRTAQASLWKSGLALQGPDSDALRAEYRDGVHFNAKGLRRHGEVWAEKVGPWLETQLAAAPTTAPAAGRAAPARGITE